MRGRRKQSPATPVQGEFDFAENVAGDRSTKGEPGRFGEPVPEKIAESEVQRRIVLCLRRAGWMVVRINSGAFKNPSGRFVATYHIFGLGGAGMSDVVAFRGVPDSASCEALFVEVKRSGGTLRKSQQEFIEFCRRFQIPVHVCDNWLEVLRIVEELPRKEKGWRCARRPANF